MTSSVAAASASTPRHSLETHGRTHPADSIALHCDDVALREAVQLALARAGISMKEAAALQGLDASQWSRQLHSTTEHPSLRRMLKLGVRFWQEFVPLLMDLCGVHAPTDPRWEALSSLLRALLLDVKPRPLKMEAR